MTITTARPGAVRTCKPGVRHGDSNAAWCLGCRCLPAVRAHERWLADRKGRRDQARAAAVAGLPCPAGTHNTLYAYENSGCRCSLARLAYRRKYYPDRGAAWQEWNRWRGPKTRVDRVNLMFLIDGLVKAGTPRERMLAIMELDRIKVIDGPIRWRHLSNEEIGVRLSLSEASVYRIRQKRAELAAGRTQRRLADSRWRAARAAMSAARATRP